MRLIDANWVHAHVKPYEPSDEKSRVTLGTAIRLIHNAIDNAPTVDAAIVVHARWIGSKYDQETGDYMEKCSHCGVFSREYWKPHCSECGALMDLDEQGEKQDV